MENQPRRTFVVYEAAGRGRIGEVRGLDARGRQVSSAAPPDVVGAVVAWLATNPDAAWDHVASDGRVIDAQDVCRELALVPGWPGQSS